MSLRPQMIAPVPEETSEIAHHAFAKGNVYMQMRDELGSIFTDEVFMDLYPNNGQPAVRPWRLALVTVMQFGENLSDRQAADAVRGRIDWKYALSLDLNDEGFHYSVLSEFRQRLLEHDAGHRLLDEMLQQFREKGLVKARGQQRTDSTHVLAAVRQLSRLENVGMTLRHALNRLAMEAPDWLRDQVTSEWFDRYGPRFEHYRLPKGKDQQRELAEQVGQDGWHLLEVIYADEAPGGLSRIPAVETLRRVWVQQFWSTEGRVRLRDVKDMPPVGEWLRSPFDIEARYCTKREMGWVGYKVHLTETCDDESPHVITQITSTVSSIQDNQMTADIQNDLARIDLLPADHLVDAGYVDSHHLVNSRNTHQINLIGPAPKDTSWQARIEDGIDQTQFRIDWDSQVATCPTGQSSITWRPSCSPRGRSVIRVLFNRQACQSCHLRHRCTRGQARSITLRPREEYQALQAARQRESTEAFKEAYRKRAGVEGTLSQAIRTAGMRRSRYIGLEKTHLQNIATAVAINLHRVINWMNSIPLAPTRKSRFAALAA
jgi:transposase